MKKFSHLLMAIVLVAVIAGVFGMTSSVSAVMMKSSNVAFIPSYYDDDVSPFPRSGTVIGTSLSFDQFTFTDVPLASLTLANLLAYDTVVLNQLYTSSLTAQQKADLNSWVDAGGKLIIYDSDGTYGNSYDWLIRPFTTNVSPGQTGSMTGTLTIVEENTLSSANPASPYYINTAETTAGSDAVGDANVFLTNDPNWFGDMEATNVLGYTGWTHAYAETPSGKGLIIYNGLDIDYFGWVSWYPSGIDWLAKIWYYELAQQWDPSGLPGTTPVSSQILLSPLSDTKAVGQIQTMTAEVKDCEGALLPGVEVTFTVTGDNPTSGTAITDAQGIATWSYSGANEGVDTIVACADIGCQGAVELAVAQSTVCSNDSHITWQGFVPPVPEASTLILFGMGVLTLTGVGLVMLKKRRAAA